jgi:hypothetical protein
MAVTTKKEISKEEFSEGIAQAITRLESNSIELKRYAEELAAIQGELPTQRKPKVKQVQRFYELSYFPKPIPAGIKKKFGLK